MIHILITQLEGIMCRIIKKTLILFYPMPDYLQVNIFTYLHILLIKKNTIKDICTRRHINTFTHIYWDIHDFRGSWEPVKITRITLNNNNVVFFVFFLQFIKQTMFYSRRWWGQVCWFCVSWLSLMMETLELPKVWSRWLLVWSSWPSVCLWDWTVATPLTLPETWDPGCSQL